MWHAITERLTDTGAAIDETTHATASEAKAEVARRTGRMAWQLTTLTGGEKVWERWDEDGTHGIACRAEDREAVAHGFSW